MKTMTKIFRVESALKEVDRAKEFACKIIREAYPEGSVVRWHKFRGLQTGTILRNGSGLGCRWDQFYVRNDVTGKEYWITFYDVKMGADI